MGDVVNYKRQAGAFSLVRPGIVGRNFWTIISDMVASILAHISRSDIGAEMGPTIGYTWPRLGPRKRAHAISIDWSGIS